MTGLKSFAFAAVAAALFSAAATTSNSQVGVSIGVAPACPYGYYDWAPYSCAPYGYYGPEWFSGGVFIGAGPWYRGPAHFMGHVDNRFDPHRGYRGPAPRPGDRAERADRAPAHFKGNEMRDGRGHVGGGHRK